MDLQMLVFCLEAFLCVSLIHAAPVSENFVVSVSLDVSVHTKHTATLPCWLSPQQSAEDMEVNWFYAEQFDAPVMLYKDKTFNSASQPASYRGRVSFGQKDASSRGLQDGDVTLKLVNVTLADAGKYTCYVSSEKHHDRASVNLFVTQTGVAPLLTAVVKENNQVNVSCESEGWYPEPKLQWSDGSRTLTPKALVYSKAPSGLLSVHSWLLVSSSSAVSCSVGFSGEEAIEGRIRVTPNPQAQGSSVVGWVLFAFVAVALVGVLGFLFFKKYRGKGDGANGSPESEKLLPKDLSAVLDEANDYYVNIGLEKLNNGFVTVKDNKLRDAPCTFPDGDKVTCITAVRGTPGFSSGKHYWEVSLGINGNATIPPKQSWWIGVTSQSVIPKDCNFSPTPDNGFWFLSSSPDKVGYLQFSTNPVILLPVCAPPQKIGVILDHEGGELAFYNVEHRSLIGLFPVKFTGEVFPLFNPGKGDAVPMEIIQRKLDDGPSDTVNTAEKKVTVSETA